ncbi:MaoC/PaaZ C-terminal domain-containing protein [Aestuariirhabdus sp. LZHN29]|uniref:MaoC/PaaZ C-terminal domain-containing protein n=1 Tax=Aestuariirhabdus sp. LZHN29 TaxID=3417462 RepID=UPI003CE77BF6
MPDLQLTFTTKPAIAPAMLKALLLPRKGFNAHTGLPQIHATWSGARVDPDALGRYLTLLGLPASETLPILYPHVMAGGMHMHMLTHKAFPIRLLGAVHLKNRIVQHRAIRADQALTFDSRMGETRLVEKGVEFDFTTAVIVEGETLWQETTTYFKAGTFGGRDNPSASKSFELASLESATDTSQWSIPTDRGKKYAAITGDYNPIHMSSLLAKLFGFKRDIAHGFGVLAQAIHHATHSRTGQDNLQVDVIFKGPLYLGSDLQIKQNLEQDPSRFDVYCGTNPKPSICAAVVEL